jgi:hypothetical protein
MQKFKLGNSWYLVTIFAVALFLCIISSCGKTGMQGPQGVPGPQGPAGTGVQPIQLTPVQQLVVTYNEYRISNGQEPLVPGLDCTLYTIPTTTTCLSTATGPAGCVVPSGAQYVSVGSFLYLGEFNQPNQAGTAGFNILPAVLQPNYSSYFRVTCTGDLFVVDDNWHSFSLSSDDGSNLYISGLLINNDGVHSIQTISASKYLDSLQPYSFEVDYFQQGGNVALILNEDGAVMGSSGWYH